MNDGVNFASVVYACEGELVHLSEIVYFLIKSAVLLSGSLVVQGLVYQCSLRVISRQGIASDLVNSSGGSGSNVVTYFEMVYGAIPVLECECL